MYRSFLVYNIEFKTLIRYNIKEIPTFVGMTN